MPYAQRSYDHNDLSKSHHKPSQSSSRRHNRRQQSSGSMTSASREQGHRITRTQPELRDPSSHRHQHRSQVHTHHQHSHHSHRSPSQTKKVDHDEPKYSTRPEQSYQLSFTQFPTQSRTRERGQISVNREFHHTHRHSPHQRHLRSRGRVVNPAVRNRQIMEGMDPRVAMMQWNSRIFASGRRNRDLVTDTIDPANHPFLPTTHYPGPITDEQLKSFSNFHRTKSQSNPDFAVPKSSLDDLLGIDAMDMYTAANPPQGPYPFHHQHPSYPGMMRRDTDPIIRTPGDRSGEFQHNCIRSLASMIVCPHTVLPITVGLFTQSGSMRETGYLQLLGEEISHLNTTGRYQSYGRRTKFSLASSLLPLIVTFLIAYILGLTLGWQLGLAVAVTATVVYLIVCAIVFFGLRGKRCPKSVQFAETLSRYIRGCQLVLNILFYRAPAAPSAAQPVKLLPISLNLTGCVSGMEAAAQMTEKLWQFAEQKYGRLAVRFQWASKDNFTTSPQTSRKYCCLPLWLWLLLSILSTLTLATLLVVRKQQDHEEAIEVTAKPQLITSKDTTAREPDSHAIQEYYINAAIVCAVLSGFSGLALLVASVPSIIRLIQGRPFQRRKQSSPYKDGGKLSEPPMDGCYGVDAARCDPVSCMRFEPRENGRFDDLLQQQQFPLHLTSAATVAATAAVAAVTAADRQWRLIEQEKAQSRRGQRKFRKSSGIKAVRQLFSPSKAVLQATEDIESNSTGGSSRSRSSSSSDQGHHHRTHSRSGSDSDDELAGPENSFFHDAVMFESGELLIHDQHHSKRHNENKSTTTNPGKSSSGKSKSAEMQNLAKWKNVIRKAMLEACKVLSLIDSRMGDRQTRVVICINATGGFPTSPASLIKLATFVRLVDRLAMQPPSGGTSNDVPVIFAPYKSDTEDNDSQPKNLNPNATPTTWTPNIIVLLVAAVPHVLTTMSTQSGLHNSFPSQLNRDGLKSCSFPSSSFPWTNFKLWWSVHHVCHLPIYLEEEPTGHRLVEPAGSQPISGSPLVSQNLYKPQGQSSLLDLFLGSNELSDLNAKRLRQLLTQIAFMGRMINIERLQVEHQGLVRIAAPDSGLLSGQAILSALVTWLCILQHWPFHAAWLAVFIEQHLRSKDSGDMSGTAGMATPRQMTKSGSGTVSAGPYGDGIDQLSWGSVLSQLHARVLKRLAPAVELARMKAMSVSLGASQPGPDFNTRHMSAYPPHVTSTLEICDLAMRDRDPRRLAEFLQSVDMDRAGLGDSIDLQGTFHSHKLGLFRAGAITVRQLLRVMRLTPLMNPQINQWIRDVLSSKMLTAENAPDARSEQEVERKMSSGVTSLTKQQMTSPRAAGTSEERIVRHTPTHLDSSCRVKMKPGMPNKNLSQMTVDDVCLLIRSITDLSVNQHSKRRVGKGTSKSKLLRGATKSGGLASSDESDSPINDPVPPAPISDKRKQFNVSNPYEDRIRHLNISGTVLSICPLSDLQKELNMSFGDWQLFSSVINYLKNRELGGTSHTCGLQQNESLRRSDPRLSHGAGELATRWPPDPHLISTVSDTSLALTVKSVPLTNQCRSPPQVRPSSAIKNAKSMSALPSGSRTCAAPAYGYATQRPHLLQQQQQQQAVFCPQHSRTAQSMGIKDPTAILCPKHQEQVKSFLNGSQRDMENSTDMAKRSQNDLRSREASDTATAQGLARRHTCGAQTKQTVPGYPVAFQTSPPTNSGRQLKQTQFEDERSRTLPNSFRENLSLGSAALVHAQYCALHQKSKLPNWPHPSQPAWISPSNSRENVINRMLAESTMQQHASMGAEPILGNRTRTRTSTHRPMKTHPTSVERTGKETQVFDFSTPARERLSNLDQMPSSSGQVARAEFCLPKDSESTSIAGELVEEVVDFSPALLEQDSSVSQDPENKEDKVESSDHQSSHSCDCNYWYSLEAAAATANATGSVKRISDSRSTTTGHAYPGLPAEQDQSTSDSLSTTRSQLDASSGTSSDRSSTEASSNEQLDKLG